MRVAILVCGVGGKQMGGERFEMGVASVKWISNKKLAGLIFGFAIVLFTTGCPAMPADGSMHITNRTDSQIGVVETRSSSGKTPTIEELIEADEKVFSRDPGGTYYWLDTFVGEEEGEWCAEDDELFVVLKTVSGELFEDINLSDPAAPEFEVVASYGSGLCVETSEYEIVHES